jgi:hypothetical protein
MVDRDIPMRDGKNQASAASDIETEMALCACIFSIAHGNVAIHQNKTGNPPGTGFY